MNKTLKGLIKLTRFDEYVYFVVITTLLGIISADGELNWRFLIVLLANWSAVGFAFMINDIEDAPDDALSTSKINRNPVSAGLISPKTAKIWTFIVAAISAVLFALLGTLPFIFGMVSLILGYLYSYRGVRLKTIAFLDFLSHCLMLAGLQYLTGYFAFSSVLHRNWYWPFLFVVCVSIYGELYNEVRDFEGDQAAQLRHTGIVLGNRKSHILMLSILLLGVVAGFVTFFLIDLVPMWVFIITAILAAIFILPPALRLRRENNSVEIQNAFQKPLERAAAFAFLLLFIAPWLDGLLQLGLF